MLSAQANEMLELITACQRRIVAYMAVGFAVGCLTGGILGAWIVTRLLTQ